MTRWEPDARRRLQEAALDLFTTHGYAETTATAIAARAGLTERTFFRHFPDKRDVLFGADTRLRDTLTEAVTAAPAGSPPHAALAAGLTALAELLQPLRDTQLRRAAIIATHPDLRERELAKLTTWAAALTAALTARGLPVAQAETAAEVAATVFRVAFTRWTDPGESRTLPTLIHHTLTEAAAATMPA
ncbi:TetR/AcrR family transcriptional regulator [Winogradskya consettensis]|uniref:TetR family transcriptional regulator n=1 Tax=Winogradskya consettensis TaxID=113560 RepID=A0A919VZJ2_9ACTN|nr:TetR/AcrR family transcriptional regulator [Actinoplanes consettensis]GIM85428.1 TetR family transcriptional regulator [Actinoplanes consettensis]